jgi:hypothetical protein
MIKPKFKANDINKAFAKKRADIDRVLIRQFQVLGEKCINLARSLETYQDQTGNLRGSIGYAIYSNGKSVGENYAGKTEGVSKAKEVAAKHGRSNSLNRIVMVVVAGMDYAFAVETKGFAVLTPAEQFAENELPKLLNKLIDKIEKA